MSISKRTRISVFMRDDFTCVYCGRHGRDVLLEADHVEPKSKGGPDKEHNLVTACDWCNGGKGDVPMLTATQLIVERIKFKDPNDKWPGQRGIAETITTVAFHADAATLARRPWIRHVLLLCRVAVTRWDLDGEQAGQLARLMVADVDESLESIAQYGFTAQKIIEEMADTLGYCGRDGDTLCWFLRNLGIWDSPLNSPEAARIQQEQHDSFDEWHREQYPELYANDGGASG